MNKIIHSESKIFNIFFEKDICIISMNDPKKSLNTFTEEALNDLDKIMEHLSSFSDLKGIIFTSSKENCFLAGADITIFESTHTKEDGQRISTEFQRVLNRFSESKVPTVSAIHGLCLGGGLELSLACHYRLCTTDQNTKLGLPEIQLGLIPGGGGTQRLPRLIGVPAALDLILTGRKIDAKKALKLGLVDDCIPVNQLLPTAIAICHRKSFSQEKLLKKRVSFFSLENNFLGRKLIESKTLESIQKNTKGHYPAAFRALHVVLDGYAQDDLKKGLELESKHFGKLLVTKESQSLIHVFRLMTEAKKNPFVKEIQGKATEKYLDSLKVGQSAVGVLGAGLMGSGIATVLAEKNLRTILLDKSHEGIQQGLAAVSSYFMDRFKKKKITSFERDLKTNVCSGSINLDSLKNCPILIEAVFEDISVKKEVLQNCEKKLGTGNFIFATNTSSIPIAEMELARKNQETSVIGMHFFSPVPKMPLVEIIVTKNTSDEVTSAVFDLALMMGKQPLIVSDGPGFFTTRILAFQMAEALQLLAEGVTIENIDTAMEKFGMPVGPITLLDEVGIDVGEHIISILKNSFEPRLVVPEQVNLIGKEGRKGRKNQFGFYSYKNGKKGSVDGTIYKHFGPRKPIPSQVIWERCIYIFLNEAARCLDEGIVKSSGQGDFGAIMGLGFPPFLGGPFHYANVLGKENVLAKLKELEKQYGERFSPTKYWSS